MGVAKLFYIVQIELPGEVVPKYGFHDTWYSPSFSKHVEFVRFSRSDRRLDINLIRLDRFYVDDFFIALGGSSQILAGQLSHITHLLLLL